MLPPQKEHEDEKELQGDDLRPLAHKLQRWRLAGLVAELLESGSAFAALAAQGLYIGQPLMETWIPKAQIRRLASMLEDPQGSAEFVRALRETSQ
ncbi:MAG: hypothetical protein WD751_02775 [Anaerolineales bacterium]